LSRLNYVETGKAYTACMKDSYCIFFLIFFLT
jgi:hypothetical protein